MSQLATWMLENPSIESEESGTGPGAQVLSTPSTERELRDRFVRPWSLGSSFPSPSEFPTDPRRRPGQSTSSTNLSSVDPPTILSRMYHSII